MFERYTEKARRVIFFARYEASQFGSPYIEAEHLLLGILRENKELTNRMLRSHTVVESIRKQIESHTPMREKVSTSVDLPLSNESKRILAYAAEEAEKLGHKHIGSEHLFLGILREEGSFAAGILKEHDVKIDAAREALAGLVVERFPQTSALPRPALEAGLVRDMTQSASDGTLPPIVARERELGAIVEVLSQCERRNAALIGPSGAGKTAVAYGLAQLIAEDRAPHNLYGKRVLEFEPELLSLWTSNSRKWDELSKLLLAQLSSNPGIVFIECSGRLTATAGPDDLTPFLRWLISNPDQQCVIAAGEEEFLAASRTRPWLHASFRSVHVRPLGKDAALAVLQSRKSSLEKFHDVTYADAALKAALDAAENEAPQHGSITRLALDLLDSAGAMVRLSCENASPEIAELNKRIHFISHRFSTAISQHEFEKARFYSDEERKERENLRLLREQGGPGAPASEVTADDIARVRARWSEYPFSNRP
jgi:ATP-dependent Clp protease ATP-binding subunit ClpC